MKSKMQSNERAFSSWSKTNKQKLHLNCNRGGRCSNCIAIEIPKWFQIYRIESKEYSEKNWSIWMQWNQQQRQKQQQQQQHKQYICSFLFDCQPKPKHKHKTNGITSTARGQMKPRMSTQHTNYTDYDNIAAQLSHKHTFNVSIIITESQSDIQNYHARSRIALKEKHTKCVRVCVCVCVSFGAFDLMNVKETELFEFRLIGDSFYSKLQR